MSSILILGAASDIAQALAHRFAQEGCAVILAGRDTQRLSAIAKDIEIRHNTSAEVCSFDAVATDTHEQFYSALATKPDVVACVFGYLGDQELAQTDYGESSRIIDTNYSGAVSMLNIVANDYEQRRAGTIIGVASVAGDRGRQSNYIYGSAKGAFAIYLAGLRNRLFKSGVGVLTVKPGFVNTKMTAHLDLPKALTAEPRKVADDIYKAWRRRRDCVYTIWPWRWIMFIIRSIPEFVFKRLSM